MFLVSLASCFLLVSLTSQEGPPQWRMPPSVRKIYEDYMHTNNPGLRWNNLLSYKAFNWVQQRNRTRGNYFTIDSASLFPKDNHIWLERKVLQILYGGFSRWWVKIKGLDKGTPFGCNHHYTRTWVHVLCIFVIF